MPLFGLSLVLGCSGPAVEAPPQSRHLHDREPLLTEDQYAEGKRRALAKAVKAVEGRGLVFNGETEYVYLSDFQFDPSVIRFRAGTITRVRLNNIARVTHYFGGEEFFQYGAEVVNILGTDVPTIDHIPVPPLSSRDIYLYIKDPGRYSLHCFVPTHQRQGMEGILEVLPAATSEAAASVPAIRALWLRASTKKGGHGASLE
ncbi:hypothetical protein [Motiliproteus sp. SC1-56]|uniref:hypothetical protein n=1 Tax=Motiliproteus sp. SC1-56 TaxID=2799565 RepID=UPI001A9075AC|nr:hypothetical protein [Motiliproteus sp. SC1-56]